MILVDGSMPQAIARIKANVRPLNARRLDKDFPCTLSSICDAALCEKSMCNVNLIIERPLGGNKITIVLVDEETRD